MVMAIPWNNILLMCKQKKPITKEIENNILNKYNSEENCNIKIT